MCRNAETVNSARRSAENPCAKYQKLRRDEEKLKISVKSY